MRMRKHEHINPILHSLHWLPVSSRIEYKVSLLTHQCIHAHAPPPPLKNLSAHITQHAPAAPLTQTSSTYVYLYIYLCYVRPWLSKCFAQHSIAFALFKGSDNENMPVHFVSILRGLCTPKPYLWGCK